MGHPKSNLPHRAVQHFLSSSARAPLNQGVRAKAAALLFIEDNTRRHHGHGPT
jgi:hypothetical protein